MVYQLTCPECGSHDVAEIVYGLVEETPELGKDVAEGRILLGGCCVESDEFHCNACKHSWGDRLGDLFREKE